MPTTTYCKRLRMEIDLAWIDPVPILPLGLVWVPWADEVLKTHADVKWQSFRGELDAAVFPNLASLDGCRYLMRVIRNNADFVPESTWLIEAENGCCGTIQGIRDETGRGMIQNVGVISAYRGLGLGGALVLKALHGFRRAGIKRAYLEVSARNRRAMRLYHRIGFITHKSFYSELATSSEEIYAN